MKYIYKIRNKFYDILYLWTKQHDIRLFHTLRKFVVKKLIRQSPSNFYIMSNVNIFNFKELSIGNHVSINHGCFLSCQGGLTIGNFVSIGHNTSILTTEHSYSDAETPIKYQPIIDYPVRIGSNVWIGANSTILAGVEIADGTIIAAGSVVTKSILDVDTIVGGVPARFLKNRLS